MKVSKSLKSIWRAALTAAALVALSGAAQTAAAQGTDFSKVEIVTTKLADNFYVLTGSGGAAPGADASGGRVGFLTGPDGVFMVDAKFAPLTAKIVAAVKQVAGNEPIRFVVNTHVHGDHTGGNENFGKMGVTLIARDELRHRLMYPNPGANGAPGTPEPAAGLPVITYEGHMGIHMDGEDIQLFAIPSAHTDGDTLIFFPNANVIMSGDFFRSVGYPNIDRANGGSLNGMLDGLALLIGMAGPDTKIAPGHGPVVTRAEVMTQRDIILAVRDRVAKMIAQGMTEEQVVAAHPTAEFDAKVSKIGTTQDRFVRQVYEELKSAK
jgi:cyclase